MLEIMVSSSVLILVLALLRLILRDRISARLQYALWLLVLVRLLVPVSFFHSPVSVAEAAAPVTERVEQLNGALVFFRNAPVSAVYTTPENEMLVIQDATPNYAADQVILLVDVARYIWITGMAVMAAWFLFMNVRLARHLRWSRTPYAANHTPPVYVGSGIPSPCLFGLIRPAIYLTEQAAADPLQARQIVAHEKTHFRHGDMIWSLLRSVCLVIWWFNPFVWLAAALSRQDGELACDEGTIKALGEDARFDYGRTLVGMAKVGARPSDLLCGATTMTTGKRSLKERVARIANAPKMSVSVAVIVLIIAAIAVGCTYGGAAENKTIAPEIAVEAPSSDSASDAEDLPAAYSVTIRDPDSGDVLTETPADDGELRELYAVYSALKTLARPLETSDVFSDVEMSYDVRFYDDDTYIGFRMWDDGTFLLFDVKFGGSPTGVYVSPELAERFLDILDEYHGEIADADFMSDVSLGGYDRAYWEEVDRELASFAVSGDVEVFISPHFEFDEELPEDDIFGPLTLEDYIYGTDGWKFTYDGEPIANDPAATIKVHDTDGRSLWIMDDADALMIEEADGSITWVAYTSDPVDCADMIRHLLPWARGEYPTQEQMLIQREEQQAELDAIVEELGHYGFPNRTEYHIAGGEILYDNGVVYNLPEWASVQQGISGKTVYAAYGTETENIDLQYERFWRDSAKTALVNTEMFENARAYYRDVLALPVTDGLRVNGHDAFAYYIPPYDAPAIMWYDADAELIFHLTEYSVGTDPQFPPLDELIVLAESISPL